MSFIIIRYAGICFFVGTATQLVILLPPHTPWIGQGGVVTLHNDLCSCLSILDFKWEVWEQITFSLAKLMTIMHIAFTGDNGWLTNGLRGGTGLVSQFTGSPFGTLKALSLPAGCACNLLYWSCGSDDCSRSANVAVGSVGSVGSGPTPEHRSSRSHCRSRSGL